MKNKHFFSFLLAMLMALPLSAQVRELQVWRNGAIVHSIATAQIDSVKFAYTLSAPTAVNAQLKGTQIQVSWPVVNGATAYEVYRSGDGQNYSSLGRTERTSFVDGFPLVGTNYYKVQSRGYKIESQLSVASAPISFGESNEMETGLYMGVLGFNETLIDKGSMSLLTPDTKGEFVSFVDGLTTSKATLLYYGVDKGLDKITSTALPGNLTNVAVVTFTDGLDQGSLAMVDYKYATRDEYRDYLSSRIKSTEVQGIPLSAYSIGLRGGDVTDYAAFTNNLKSLASQDDFATEVSNMNDVNQRFQDIANQLIKVTQTQTLSIKLPKLDDGQVYRFTFDNVSNAANSKVYIEGTLNARNNTLNNIKYVGLTCNSGASLQGQADGVIKVVFEFENIKAADGELLSLAYINEYYYTGGYWQVNSEFDKDADLQVDVKRSSAAIMLVLDCSSSLQVNGDKFTEMKKHVKSFIETLAQALSENEEGGDNKENEGGENNNDENESGVVELKFKYWMPDYQGGDITAGTPNVQAIVPGTPYALLCSNSDGSEGQYLCNAGKSAAITDSCLFVFEVAGENAEGETVYMLKRNTDGKYLQNDEGVKFTTDAEEAYRFTAGKANWVAKDEIAELSFEDLWTAGFTKYVSACPMGDDVWVFPFEDFNYDDPDTYTYFSGWWGGNSPVFWSYIDVNAWKVVPVYEAKGAEWISSLLAEYFPSGFSYDAYAPGENPGQCDQALLDACNEAYNACYELMVNESTDDAACRAAGEALIAAYDALIASVKPIGPGYYYFVNWRTDGHAAAIYASDAGVYWDYTELPEAPTVETAAYVWQLIQSEEDPNIYYLKNYKTGKYIGGKDGLSQVLPQVDEPFGYNVTYNTNNEENLVGYFNIANPKNPGNFTMHTQVAGKNLVYWYATAPASLWKVLTVDEADLEALKDEVEQTMKVYTVNGVSFKMVPVEGGTFTMGATVEQGSDADDYEKPKHQVTLSSYAIGETEVTQELWRAVMGSDPSYFSGNQLPVEVVSWNDCQTFITKLNQLTGANFRLPTEAEWEFAARGGNKSLGYKYAGGNSIDDVVWYSFNSSSQTHAVAQKQPNELGLYDMSGNVYERCQDWYGSYSSAAQTNPTGPASGSLRVIRGGSWNNTSGDCRVSARLRGTPTNALSHVGLRLAQ